MLRSSLFATALALSAIVPLAAQAEASKADPLVTVIDGAHRSSDDRSRDVYRHPQASLQFWGLQPGKTVLEVQPGQGWWTEILAPYARATGGEYYATAADLNNPALPEGARTARAAYEARFSGKPGIYGDIKLISYGPKSAPLPQEKFDFVLTARSVHGWVAQGMADKVFKDLYAALKPGGILALEQHRAAPGKQDPKAADGYVAEEYVIKLAQQAGFELAGRSELNANAKDTKDHPFGVWTLPPNARTRPYMEGPNAHDPKFDRTKYDAIGESDRMTLKFVKPKK